MGGTSAAPEQCCDNISARPCARRCGWQGGLEDRQQPGVAGGAYNRRCGGAREVHHLVGARAEPCHLCPLEDALLWWGLMRYK